MGGDKIMIKKEYPILHLVNWYYGNYCARKCFDKMDRLSDHHNKMLDFARKNPTLKMTHKDFLQLFNNHINLCTLHDSFKRRAIFWKMFTDLQNTENYDSDKIIVENKRLKLIDGDLEKPKQKCEICKAFKIPQ